MDLPMAIVRESSRILNLEFGLSIHVAQNEHLPCAYSISLTYTMTPPSKRAARSPSPRMETTRTSQQSFAVFAETPSPQVKAHARTTVVVFHLGPISPRALRDDGQPFNWERSLIETNVSPDSRVSQNKTSPTNDNKQDRPQQAAKQRNITATNPLSS